MAVTVMAGAKVSVYYDGRRAPDAYNLFNRDFEVTFRTPSGDTISGSVSRLKASWFKHDSSLQASLSDSDNREVSFVFPASSAATTDYIKNHRSDIIGLYVRGTGGSTHETYRIESIHSVHVDSTSGDVTFNVRVDRPIFGMDHLYFSGDIGVIEFTSDVGSDIGVGYLDIKESSYGVRETVAVSIVSDPAHIDAPILIG